MASTPVKSNATKHSLKPPCDCPQCREATEAADSRLSAIAELFDRLNWLEIFASSEEDDE